ncbi:MAG: phosphopantetheine-binding protein [Candidatus Competibacteraceae bacterium]
MTSELEILIDYIRSEMGYKEKLEPDMDLLKKGVLDSFSIVQLAMFIQDRFEIELEAEDLVRTNFATLSSMVALIEKKKAAACR